MNKSSQNGTVRLFEAAKPQGCSAFSDSGELCKAEESAKCSPCFVGCSTTGYLDVFATMSVSNHVLRVG